MVLMFVRTPPIDQEVLINGGMTMRSMREATDGRALIGSMGIETIGNIIPFGVGRFNMEARVQEPAAESGAEARIAALIAHSADDSDVRYELIAALREKMAAGRYRVAASDVAAKLMGSMLG